MSHLPPNLSLDDPWWGVAQQIAKGEPLRKREVEAILVDHPNPPDWVVAVIREHDRNKRWAKGRAPVGGFKRLSQITKAMSLFDCYYEEEKAKKRTRGMDTPLNRALDRVGETLRISADAARDLVYPGRRKPRKHEAARAKPAEDR